MGDREGGEAKTFPFQEKKRASTRGNSKTTQKLVGGGKGTRRPPGTSPEMAVWQEEKEKKGLGRGGKKLGHLRSGRPGREAKKQKKGSRGRKITDQGD